MLNTIVQGEETAQPPIVIAHGLFGSARNWGVIAKRLSASRRVLTVDMRNHGDSPWQASHGYPDLAADLAGGLLSLAVLSLRQMPLPILIGRPWLDRIMDPKSGIPYGVALAAGALYTLPHSDLWRLAGLG